MLLLLERPEAQDREVEVWVIIDYFSASLCQRTTRTSQFQVVNYFLKKLSNQLFPTLVLRLLSLRNYLKHCHDIINHFETHFFHFNLNKKYQLYNTFRNGIYQQIKMVAFTSSDMANCQIVNSIFHTGILAFSRESLCDFYMLS